MNIHLTEIFGPTLQGEGILAGTPSTFVRTAGCSVGCRACDTKISWPFINSGRHKQFTVEQIINKVKADKTRYVVITGGEPMECEEPDALAYLCECLVRAGVRTTIELSGSVPGSDKLMASLLHNVYLWSFSPKVTSMHPKKLPVPEFIANTLISAEGRMRLSQLKFVIDDVDMWKSIDEIDKLLLRLFGLCMPTVPVIFQTLTRYNESSRATLDRARFLFEEAAKDLGRPIGGQYTAADIRWTFQNHVLLGVR